MACGDTFFYTRGNIPIKPHRVVLNISADAYKLLQDMQEIAHECYGKYPSKAQVVMDALFDFDETLVEMATRARRAKGRIRRLDPEMIEQIRGRV